ncbi:patatin-like phospholipase family protein [Wolbachia endosymbiont of Diaphorina citri]|uniref:patatin-like phospholipase family protein n=1 Tax=Wolbachia endosymbiont of Diaphorina citri TaxID=116598 RepID=UPI00155F4AB8|nr:patatin-like phospholipase family protein [Wolbachia endosymbiont of Diaphorina citri]QJT94917.1 patatin-like phospholipase family protein [Wolbachia endosymbiont of Diaphorina citri]QJT96019.1 patatin-like phospholipase family protein [Wolbachia endosymbiont of Diaphorina citri]QJT97381.1 patatin-like phospholipase family protein [Wolbachia endosymbiont of Diaphorina citri]QLK11865.1 patatin [Wolbachia endosymbiont of Diaphorina citri]QXY86790.1 patatin [Wolbachia endosymbiont of Diaphorin
MIKYILSVDGGGIRGIIPAIILAEIEKRTRRTIAEIFHLMAGTSTGGIVIAGLCKKDKQGNPQYSANDLVELYQKYGSYIFKSSFFRRSILSWFNCAQYPHKNIEFVLDKYFGDDTLQNTLNNVLLTSYDIQNNCPFFFKSWKEGNIKLKDALRAATAAPTYFAPKYLKINHKEMVLVDGGVFANNPAACAYASGKRLFPNDDILLLSIGTGRTDRSIEYANSKRFGKIGWIKPLLSVMFASGLDCVNYQMNQVIGNRYVRIQSQLKLASADMDNITSKNIKFLQQEANAMIEDNQKVIEKFCIEILNI